MKDKVKDLIALVADADMEAAIRALFSRPSSLGIRPIAFDVMRHVQRDAGCRSGAHDFLRLWLNAFRYAVVLFDHEGCGREQKARNTVELEVEKRLEANGWRGRCAAVVIAPELESWVWSDSPIVDDILGWRGYEPGLREWVKSKTDFWQGGQAKPERPKEAFEAALRSAGKPRSAVLFEELAGHVSVERCLDPSFLKLKRVLSGWFPAKDTD
ncbi:MAG: hypothetical protein JW821_02635 [Deltaproteobacteria bacterium]|nr:hypothetical protein [Deltaproteobacteria bacterium]